MFFFLASSQLFPAFIPSVDAGSDRGRGERARGDRRKCTQTEAAGAARARDRGDADDDHDGAAWRMAGGRAWERRDNDRGLIDTRRVDMDCLPSLARPLPGRIICGALCRRTRRRLPFLSNIIDPMETSQTLHDQEQISPRPAPALSIGPGGDMLP